MKSLFNGAQRCTRRCFALCQSWFVTINKAAVFFSCITLIGVLFIACQKQELRQPVSEMQSLSGKSSEAVVLNLYTGLSAETSWELQQARAATAKYRNFDNAIKDGYVDINVVLPNMGYHYMRMEHVDATFDYRKPEILVYNKDDDDNLQLVAVEYAVPISLSPSIAPAGFTGTADVWDYNTGFGLWLLHAWVWSYNPDGVFNPTNPLVHLH